MFKTLQTLFKCCSVWMEVSGGEDLAPWANFIFMDFRQAIVHAWKKQTNEQTPFLTFMRWETAVRFCSSWDSLAATRQHSLLWQVAKHWCQFKTWKNLSDIQQLTSVPSLLLSKVTRKPDLLKRPRQSQSDGALMSGGLKKKHKKHQSVFFIVIPFLFVITMHVMTIKVEKRNHMERQFHYICRLFCIYKELPITSANVECSLSRLKLSPGLDGCSQTLLPSPRTFSSPFPSKFC